MTRYFLPRFFTNKNNKKSQNILIAVITATVTNNCLSQCIALLAVLILGTVSIHKKNIKICVNKRNV